MALRTTLSQELGSGKVRSWFAASQHIQLHPEMLAAILLVAVQQAAIQSQELRPVAGDDAVQATVSKGFPLPPIMTPFIGVNRTS
jgi:hypothetical protein